jgi:membrane fusion protein (multidrug efflux system)
MNVLLFNSASRRAIVAVLAILASGLGLGTSHAQGNSSLNAKLRPTPVAADTTSPVRVQVVPRRFTTLAAEIGARIEKITVREGESFKAGQPLVELDCAIMRAQLARAKTQLGVTERILAANQRLLRLNSAGSIEVETAAAEAAKAKADLEVMEATVSKCVIPAPFSGRVVEQKVRELQYVQPGQALIEILDDQDLEIEFVVPSQWLLWLKKGDAFSVDIEETGKTYPARVLKIGAKVDAVSQSIKITGEINSDNPDFLAGMSGRALFPDRVLQRAQSR